VPDRIDLDMIYKWRESDGLKLSRIRQWDLWRREWCRPIGIRRNNDIGKLMRSIEIVASYAMSLWPCQ